MVLLSALEEPHTGKQIIPQHDPMEKRGNPVQGHDCKQRERSVTMKAEREVPHSADPVINGAICTALKKFTPWPRANRKATPRKMAQGLGRSAQNSTEKSMIWRIN